MLNDALQFGLIERMALKMSFVRNITKNVERVQLPELDLGMKRNLWGLTLWIWSYCLQMALASLKEVKEESKNVALENCLGR